MQQVYRLITVVLISGTLAGLALFAMQYFAVAPLIEKAERLEKHSEHEEAEWHPANGWERVSLTALTTVVSAIGFSAILFGTLALAGKYPDARQGALWGLAAFLCFHLAPAAGLPPQPPGGPEADLASRQLWWSGVVVATAVGIWLIAGKRAWWQRMAGAACMAMPHILGAPAAEGSGTVPLELARQFAMVSLATTAVFWPLLGAIGGSVYRRLSRAAPTPPI